jgi:glutathione S-transferase
MRVYAVPHTRSSRALWTLEEAGAPYELVKITREEKTQLEHRTRHPLGRVPVIEEDGGHVFESAAICLHIADQHPDAGLIPPVGTHERALVYQWCFCALTELEPPVVDVYNQRTQAETADEAVVVAASARFRENARAFEDALAGREFLLGDRFTVADVVTGDVIRFARFMELTDDFPNLNAYLERLDARPARQRADAL